MSVLAEAFPALDAPTEAALRASIERFGVLVSVVHDQNGRVLDGHHRSRIADELGVEYRIDVREVVDEEEAHEISRTLNADRRHLTVDQRRPMVVALREEGHSARAIAGALGVSHPTVLADLKTTGKDLPVERVTGLDGKSRPATRPKTTPETNGKAKITNVAHKPASERVAMLVAKIGAIADALDTYDWNELILNLPTDERKGLAKECTRGLGAIRTLKKELENA